ncbi:MAG: amino acid adenylation domain-containing protein [Clostridia bacterium]|nr:amino acid adenylation domain-containing protein [Clostridia bacterium]
MKRKKNILEYLEDTVLRVPQKTAFSNGKEDMSFGELYRASRAVGTELARLGLRGEAVAVFMDKHPNAMAAFFGTIYAGCFYVCIDSAMPEERVRLILENVSARAIIADAKGMAKASKFETEYILRFEEIARTEEDAGILSDVRRRQIDTDPIYVVFTSGSTGVPKGVVACHRSVIDYTEALCEALGFSENTVFGNQTPLYFDAPLKEIMPTLMLGATTYFIPKMLFSFPVKLVEYLNTNKINTICWVVSALVQVSTLGALDVTRPEYLTTVAFGSEVFPKKDYKIWRDTLPNARFFNLYGPTEATGMSCFWRAERELCEDEPIPIGEPFDNTDIILLGDGGREAAEGEEGEICIRGTCLTMGYYGNDEKTSEAFVQNPLNRAYPELIYRTGDIGRYNEYGELVFVTRRDSQIKHMGHRIELGEIDSSVLKCGGTARACSVYDGDKKRIVLFYVGELDPSELQKQLAQRLPRYMLPAEAVRLDSLPLTDNGKTDRRKLKDMACGN